MITKNKYRVSSLEKLRDIRQNIMDTMLSKDPIPGMLMLIAMDAALDGIERAIEALETED